MNQYKTKIINEAFAKVSLQLLTIEDLDSAIDALCAQATQSDEEKFYLESLCPYFGVIWPAARALAEHLAGMGNWLAGKTVLEVGCGLALPSLVAAKLQAKVTATDFHPDVVDFLTKNIELNHINPINLEYKNLDWKDQNTHLGTFDFVIASDVLYEAYHPQVLAKQLVAHCHKASHLILTDPGRSYLQACLTELSNLGFRYDVLIRTVADTQANRAGDKATKEVFVIVAQKQ